ncbi:hypothetical protein [Mesobacillus subterraneus]|uniref:Uncharacterized protein n=1 Tax=Mesobacillus subterraneus TaxID=285983 RepID=A0A3R9EZ42_9BACI|nr:hypothetical protein [Mesobacillus subterraneus]RSD25476.1 hypothetical protein EJA10_16860 [Mesobacillus subterraneus]
MWNWVWILLIAIGILLIIEEISQFIWRRYLKDPNEENTTLLRRITAFGKQTINKYRKNPSL